MKRSGFKRAPMPERVRSLPTPLATPTRAADQDEFGRWLTSECDRVVAEACSKISRKLSRD